MDRSTWQQISDLFEAALDKPADERTAFLDEACAGRADLRQEVAALLAAHDESDDEDLASPAGVLTPEAPLTGLHLGPYELHEPIGHGGMSDVYRATRADDQYRREVAVKLVKPGLRMENVEQRFRMERQILARLDHPNIATLLDGGVTDDGRPYLVMPYVDGRPITEHADHAKLNVDQRLALIRTVCQAVQFAHANLVVHRDLKPSNILVTDAGEVRLLDFGIAKLLDPGSLDVTVAHTGDARLLTPDYAAPEQVKGAAITTATDVHALGVLLFELLTGRRPYRGTTSLELQKAVCEQEAPRPSIVSAQPLGGDLDAIVMMALRKEPQRRYSSAGQLGDDLGRVLAGRPVVARPDTVGYRVRKFVSRNRLAVVSAAAVGVLLVSATLFSARQSQQRAAALAVAEAERDKAEQLSEFLIDIFRESEPSGGEDVTARQLLDAGARRLEYSLDTQPLLQADMADAIGEAYGALGLYDQADSLFATSLSRRSTLLPPGHPDLATSLTRRGELRAAQGRLPEALAALDSALAMLADNPDVDANQLADLLEGKVSVHLQRGEYDIALRYLDQARAVLEAAPDEHLLTLIAVWRGYGRLATLEGRHEDALAHHRHTLALWPDSLIHVHPRYYDLLESTANAMSNNGQRDSAVVMHRETLTGRERMYGPDHPTVAYSLHNLGRSLGKLGRYEEAVPAYERAVAIRENTHGPDHPTVAHALESLAIASAMNGDLAGAEPQFRRTLAIYETALGPEHPETVETITNLAYLCNVMNLVDETLDWLELAVDRGWNNLTQLREGPYAGLAGNDRFDALVARVEAAPTE